MAPHPRVINAYHAMKELGISEQAVKPVLKELLRVYEKNWELIEAENYRVLADAIFDKEDNKGNEPAKKIETNNDDNTSEEIRKPENTKKPLKRLRLKYQDPAVSFSDSRLGSVEGSSSKMPRMDDSSNSQSWADRINPAQPKIGSSSVVSDRVALIKPKDEPFTDDVKNSLQLEAPVSTVPQGNSSGHNDIPASSNERTVQELSDVSVASRGSIEIASSHVGDIQVSMRCSYAGRTGFHMPELDAVLKSVEDKCRSDVDKSFSAAKLMRDICDSCLELGSKSVKELTEAEEASNLTVNEESMNANASDESVNPEAVALELPKDPAPLDGRYYPIFLNETGVIDGDKNGMSNGQEHNDDVPRDPAVTNASSNPIHPDDIDVINGGGENGKLDMEEHDINVLAGRIPAEQNVNPSEGVESAFDVDDVSKGFEKVPISLINEVDNTPPPSFTYIPRNLIFQKAYVNISIARIGEEDCCADCSEDCLSAKVSCACAEETGGEFAYTTDGLVKEGLLDECISMNRDPKKHCQFYCKDRECPIERSKTGDTAEPCKGHLVRKFIKECWTKCGCGLQCGNRVVQRGITRKLQVFMSPKGYGWGLRTLEDLPKGTFVCEYVGEILTNAELYDRNANSTLKHAYPVLLDADWGSEKVLKDEEALCLDATYYGNVARFINHRCYDSTMVEIPVIVETPDRHYYHLAFFTTKDVASGDELTWDYGIDFDDREHPIKAFKCCCGSKHCRNIRRARRKRMFGR